MSRKTLDEIGDIITAWRALKREQVELMNGWRDCVANEFQTAYWDELEAKLSPAFEELQKQIEAICEFESRHLE